MFLLGTPQCRARARTHARHSHSNQRGTEVFVHFLLLFLLLDIIINNQGNKAERTTREEGAQSAPIAATTPRIPPISRESISGQVTSLKSRLNDYKEKAFLIICWGKPPAELTVKNPICHLPYSFSAGFSLPLPLFCAHLHEDTHTQTHAHLRTLPTLSTH